MNGNAPTKKVGDTLFLREFVGVVFIHYSITTGVRQGELLALRWKDVDLERGTIHIRQTLSHDGKEFISGAKTASGVRPITLLSETIKVLKRHRLTLMEEKVQAMLITNWWYVSVLELF